MIRYVLKRFLLMIPIVLIVTFIIYAILNSNVNSILYSIAGLDASDEVIAKVAKDLGLDRPMIVRYIKYIGDIVLHHDFGRSYMTKRVVWNEIVNRLPISIRVSFNGMLVATVIGVPLGILSAVKQYSILDRISTVSSMFMSAVPAFWLMMMLVLLFAVKWRVLPTSGIDSWVCYIMPAFGLGLPYAASQMRYTRTSVLDAIRQEYVDTARSKGVPERKVITKHVVKNSLLPIITVTGTHFGGLVGGAVVTETLFALPGIGSYMMTGINSRDVPVVCGSIVVLSLLYSIVILIIDLLYALIDPRIKARYAKKKG